MKRALLICTTVAAIAVPAGFASGVGDGGVGLPACNSSNRGATALIFLAAPNWYGHFTCRSTGWIKDWIRQL